MFGVEHDDAELLHRPGAVLRQQIGGELARRRQAWTFRHATHEGAPAQLNGGDDLRRPGRPHASHVSQPVEAEACQTMYAARAFDQTVGELECVSVPGIGAEHKREQLVVAKARGAKAHELLARPIVWCHLFHRRYTQPHMGLRWFPARACLLAVLVVSGCAAPPNKEMDQAQGAIDAARAAGADQYATTEYSAAAEALTNANTAVAARDYRLALSYALDSREQAQNAARGAADAKARVRVEVDRAIAEIAAFVTRGRTQLAAAERARVPRRRLAQPAAGLTAAEADLQKAGEAIAAADYLAAKAMLEGLRARVDATLATLRGLTASQAPGRRR